MKFVLTERFFSGRLNFLKTILFFFLFITFVFAQESGQRNISLQQALEIAGNQAYHIQIAEEQLKEVGGQNIESWSAFLPRLNLSENYIKSTDPVSVFGLKLQQGVFNQNDFALPALNDPEEFDNYTTALQVQQPLVNLDAIFNKTALSNFVDAAKSDLKRSRQVVDFQIKRAYFALILIHQNLKTIENALRSAKAHRENAQAAFDEGIITRADYLLTEITISRFTEQEITIKSKLLEISEGLKLLMGIPDESRQLFPSDSLPLPLVQTDTLVTFSIDYRPDIQAFHLKKRAAYHQMWAARSAWIPRLNGFAKNEWHSSELFKQENRRWTVGISLSWNVFDGMGHWGRYQKAKARHKKMKIQFEQTKQKALIEIKTLQNTIKAARQRIVTARLALQQARESLRLTEERFNQGLEKTSDLLEKSTLFIQSELQFLKARHDYALAVASLELSLGKSENL